MAGISKYAQNLMAWLERYNLSAIDLKTRIGVNNLRGTFTTYLNEVITQEKPAPTGFATGSIYDTSIILTWDAVSGADHYVIERCADNKFIINDSLTAADTAQELNYNPITTFVGSSSNTYTDTTAIPGETYFYRVSAVISGDTVNTDNVWSPIIEVTSANALGASASLTPSNVYDTSVTWTWAAVAGATGYVLERATNSAFSTGLTTVYTGALLVYTNTGLTPGTTYYYRVHATKTNYTTVTDTTNSTVLAAALAASASLTPSAVTSTGMTLTWIAVPNATGYVLERATNSAFSTGLTTVYTGALLTANDTGLTTATTYYYRVHATATGFTTINYATATQITS